MLSIHGTSWSSCVVVVFSTRLVIMAAVAIDGTLSRYLAHTHYMVHGETHEAKEQQHFPAVMVLITLSADKTAEHWHKGLVLL